MSTVVDLDFKKGLKEFSDVKKYLGETKLNALREGLKTIEKKVNTKVFTIPGYIKRSEYIPMTIDEEGVGYVTDLKNNEFVDMYLQNDITKLSLPLTKDINSTKTPLINCEFSDGTVLKIAQDINLLVDIITNSQSELHGGRIDFNSNFRLITYKDKNFILDVESNLYKVLEDCITYYDALGKLYDVMGDISQDNDSTDEVDYELYLDINTQKFYLYVGEFVKQTLKLTKSKQGELGIKDTHNNVYVYKVLDKDKDTDKIITKATKYDESIENGIYRVNSSNKNLYVSYLTLMALISKGYTKGYGSTEIKMLSRGYKLLANNITSITTLGGTYVGLLREDIIKNYTKQSKLFNISKILFKKDENGKLGITNPQLLSSYKDDLGKLIKNGYGYYLTKDNYKNASYNLEAQDGLSTRTSKGIVGIYDSVRNKDDIISMDVEDYVNLTKVYDLDTSLLKDKGLKEKVNYISIPKEIVEAILGVHYADKDMYVKSIERNASYRLLYKHSKYVID